MPNDAYFVVSNPSGGWDVKRQGTLRASAHTDTKEEAVNIARNLSKKAGVELIIKKLDGRFQSRDSHGHDPYPPKG